MSPAIGLLLRSIHDPVLVPSVQGSRLDLLGGSLQWFCTEVGDSCCSVGAGRRNMAWGRMEDAWTPGVAFRMFRTVCVEYLGAFLDGLELSLGSCFARRTGTELAATVLLTSDSLTPPFPLSGLAAVFEYCLPTPLVEISVCRELLGLSLVVLSLPLISVVFPLIEN